MEAKVERNRAIYEKRLAGATFKEISEEFDISDACARALFKKEKRNEERKSNPIYLHLREITDNEEAISRVWTILKRKNMLTKEELIKVDRNFLIKKCRNCGDVLADIIMELAERVRSEK